MDISADFDSGNILVDSVGGQTARLRIRPDTNANYFQWFHFRVEGAAGGARTLIITNASQATYAAAWHGYRALASHDGHDWFRVPTRYDGTNLIIEHTPEQTITTYAFFVPYSEARRAAFLQECRVAGGAEHDVIATTLEGRTVDRLTFGSSDPAAIKIWIVSRQHAGEPMAEWCTEGLIRRLMNRSDATAQALLSRARLYIVPNMNPDGSYAGNLRANAAGVDLNRAWNNASDNAPEILGVRDAIARTGVDLFIDVHGDEERRYLWIVPPDGVEQSPAQLDIQRRFEAEMKRYNPEVLPAPRDVSGVKPGDRGMSVNYIAEVYGGAPGWIIELPFGETGELGMGPDSLLPAGCIRVGESMVDVLATLTATWRA